MDNSAYFYTCEASCMPTAALTIQGERSVYIYLGSYEDEKFKLYVLIVQLNG